MQIKKHANPYIDIYIYTHTNTHIHPQQYKNKQPYKKIIQQTIYTHTLVHKYICEYTTTIKSRTHNHKHSTTSQD